MAHRSDRGNMLAMVAATAFLIIAVMMFGLQYLSVNRGHMEQKTAAEAAALAVAQDIGRIMINTPECGNVCLLDHAPAGQGTIADDNWFCATHSINELMAIARLDYIIADQLGDDFMKQLALQHRQNVIDAKDKLIDVIKASLKPGGTAKDIYGNDIKPYDDALAIYTSNNAKISNYIAPSLTIELGCLEGGIGTQVALPKPESKASVNASAKMGGCYVSEQDVEYSGEHFVFASTGKQVGLGDLSKWREAISGLPYQMPAVVKVEADQKFIDQGKEFVMHFAACASPGNDIKHPTGGAFVVEFPDGPCPELTKPKELFEWDEMKKAKCSILSVDNGDFPVDTEATIGSPPWPQPAWSKSPPPASDVSKLGLFDWLRSAGSGVNIDSFMGMLNGNFDPPAHPTVLWKARDPLSLLVITLGDIPEGVGHIYTVNQDGGILYRSKTIKPFPYTIAAHKQLYAELESGQDLKSKVATWKLVGVTFSSQKKSCLPPKINICQDDWLNQKYWQDEEQVPLLAYFPDDAEVGGGHGNGGHGGSSKGGDKGEHKGGEGKGDYEAPKAQIIEGTEKFDFYFRDMVRMHGSESGGLHEGEPMDNPAISHHCIGTDGNTIAMVEPSEVGGGATGYGNGSGSPPIISRQDDFATGSLPTPPYRGYSYGPDTGAPRPTYVQNGVCVLIRFRRQVKVGDLLGGLIGADVGYVGEILD